MKISLIITTKNETRTISKLLSSIAKQTRIPDEIIIANVGPLEKISIPPKLVVSLIELPLDANRAFGRNRAIGESRYEHILITDAGCRLKEDWVEKMCAGFKSADVVAGFYASDAQSVFEACVAPYALVMPDKLNRKTFLPATRSMGITTSVFEKMGKFNEAYRYAEDYEFARRLKTLKIPIAVVQEAIVYWRPRTNLVSFCRMIFEHAFGDGYSKTFRPKVALIFLRYFLWLCLLPFAYLSQPFFFFYLFSFVLYLTYAVYKNYRYVDHWKALIYLPILQIVSDFAVMWGTLRGSLSAQ